MGITFIGTCCGCKRTNSQLRVADNTPVGKEDNNLYCVDCHQRGKAAHRPDRRIPPRGGSGISPPKGVSRECRQRIILIDRDLLRAALLFPEGTVIIDASDAFSSSNCLAFKIEHPDFSPLKPGQNIPEIAAWFGLGSDGKPHFERWQE